jgi:alpha-glucosidase
VHGAITLLDAPEDILAFLRHGESGQVLCVFNLGEAPGHWSPPADLGPLRLIATESTVDTGGALAQDMAPGTGYWAVVAGS